MAEYSDTNYYEVQIDDIAAGGGYGDLQDYMNDMAALANTTLGNAEAAKASADRAEAAAERLSDLESEIEPAVGDWLDAHPEATTTVQDGAVTEQKLSDSAKSAVIQAENPLGSTYASDSTGDSIILATYNVLSANYWRYPANPPCDTDEGLVRASRNIRVANPDIIGMNEIPDNPKYTPLEKLKEAGYTRSFFFGTQVAGMQNVLFGNPIMFKERFTLLNASGYQYEAYSSQYRCYSNVKLELPSGKQISIYETHLGLSAEEKAAQVLELKAAVSADTTPYKFVMGDFNIAYGTSEYNDLLYGWMGTVNTDLPTGINSSRIIDYIFHTSNVTVLDYGTIETDGASDHRMLWASVALV